MYLVDQSKPCAQIYLPKNFMLHKFAITKTIFLKSIISDIIHRITYMYINFHQNRVSRSVKTVRTIIFAKNTICINLQLPIFKKKLIA